MQVQINLVSSQYVDLELHRELKDKHNSISLSLRISTALVSDLDAPRRLALESVFLSIEDIVYGCVII